MKMEITIKNKTYFHKNKFSAKLYRPPSFLHKWLSWNEYINRKKYDKKLMQRLYHINLYIFGYRWK